MIFDRRTATRKTFLSLPERKWNDISNNFFSVVVFPLSTLHDSGYCNIAIVGIYGGNRDKGFLCSQGSGDISWKNLTRYSLRTDFLPTSKAIQFWTDHGTFQIGHALSSIEIKIHPKEI